MKLLLLLFIGFNFLAHAGSKDFIFLNRNRQNKQSYFQLNGVRIADSPQCREKQCWASKMSHNKLEIKKLLLGGQRDVNPTSTVCKNLNGEPLIGFLENGNEISLCQFTDGSFAFSWDLMKR